MRERRQIVKLWQQGKASVLVTLVRAEGSSYRQPGARLLFSGSEYAGTISGGCLEADVLRKAVWLVRNGAAIETYSTAFDDTAEIPFGLGCGGVIDLLMEPVETPECHALLSALESTLAGARRTILTWLPCEGKAFFRMVLNAEGDVLFASKGLSKREISDAALRVMQGLPLEPETVFVEHLAPPQRLFVMGAGDDARPLVSMAALLGWGVTVTDGRAQLARAERFPEAERISTAFTGEIQNKDAVVLMTHSYEQDRERLIEVLPYRPMYLGLLGARHRSSLLIAEAAERLGYSISDCCESINAPVGLDLGGEGPDAIALAILAEIQAHSMGKPVWNPGRLSPESVERYIAEGGAARYLQAQCALDAT